MRVKTKLTKLDEFKSVDNMVIIDFERKGNVVRFYLGKKEDDWGWTNKHYKYNGGNGLETPDWLKPSDTYYGDDWDDAPYEHNAGSVYGEFVKGYLDVAFDFDDVVLEPCNGEYNSNWRKDDMVSRLIPCIVVIPKKLLDELGVEEWQVDSFERACCIDGVEKFYFGDEVNE